MAQPDFAYRNSNVSADPWSFSRSTLYNETYRNGAFDNSNNHFKAPSTSYTPGTASYIMPATMTMGPNTQLARADAAYGGGPALFGSRPISGAYGASSGLPPAYGSYQGSVPQGAWEPQGRFSPSDSVDDLIASPSLSEYSLENTVIGTTPPGAGKHKMGKGGANGRSQRRPSNRDEFDGPHQFLQRPPPDYIAMQERELPHLPTHLLVQEQDSILAQVNDRLSQCAYDFVAKYQFPIPLTQDMRPVERPQDREWTEWVYLLKRLATKRRVPARVLYNGQIKQFVTILENSLEMRHAAKHQSRPLKDDRNILQLISAGIQVAKILKDAPAMEYLDRLYISTEKQIHERAAAAAARFR